MLSGCQFFPAMQHSALFGGRGCCEAPDLIPWKRLTAALIAASQSPCRPLPHSLRTWDDASGRAVKLFIPCVCLGERRMSGKGARLGPSTRIKRTIQRRIQTGRGAAATSLGEHRGHHGCMSLVPVMMKPGIGGLSCVAVHTITSR